MLRRGGQWVNGEGQLRFAPTTRATNPGRACATEFRASSSTMASTSSSSSVGGSARSWPHPATTRTITDSSSASSWPSVAIAPSPVARLVRLHLDGRPRGPLFLSNRETRLSVRRIQSVVRTAARRAGIDHKRISPHTLRRTWATMTRNVGMPLDSVQAMLGHSDPKTTLIYTQLANGRARHEYDAAMAVIAGMAPDGRARIGA